MRFRHCFAAFVVASEELLLLAAPATTKNGKTGDAGAIVEQKATGSESESSGRSSTADASNGGTKNQYVEELTAQSFVERVEKIANGSDIPSYQPLVMFHMPWCEHCRKTVPELEEAASKVAQAVERKKVTHHVVPKFFMLSCASNGSDGICKTHAVRSYPSIIAFREGRSIRYTRPRAAGVLTWWALRVTRLAVTNASSKAVVDSTAEQEVTFVLNLAVDSANSTQLLRTWETLALDYIEDYTFFHTLPDSPLGRMLGQAPSVYVQGPSSMRLVPLPIAYPINASSLRAWVNYNQFSPVVNVNPKTLGGLRRSGLTVVALVHSTSPVAKAALRDFQAKAMELRTSSKFLFGSMNSTDEDTISLLNSKFPLLAPSLLAFPAIFVFANVQGQLVYWEDPRFVSVNELTVGAIERLLADPIARHDESLASWLRERRKMISRFASRSRTGLLLVLVTPIAAFCFLCACCKALWRALCAEDDLSLDSLGCHEHVD
jgi:thiol-disulfide isomerase/thioredoxin